MQNSPSSAYSWAISLPGKQYQKPGGAVLYPKREVPTGQKMKMIVFPKVPPMKKVSLILLASVSFASLYSQDVLAACSGTGAYYVCDTNSPNPWTTTIGEGRNTPSYPPVGTIITVNPGATVSVEGNNAISIHDDATLVIDGTVQNHANQGNYNGNYGTGSNTIEANSNTTITIGVDGKVIKTGTQNNAEAINLHGFSNQINNYGLVQAENAAVIWFQDEVQSGAANDRNVVNNFGQIIHTQNGNAIGTSHGNGIIFQNHTGALVQGNLVFSQGNDSLVFFPNSTVTGNIDGGGGTNDLTLNGVAGSDDSLAGALKNFTSLKKTGEGRWTITGPLTGFNTVLVEQGILGLTGDNAGYNGTLTIDPGATVEARAQSLPTNSATGNVGNVINNGLVNFVQNDNGTYIGQIVGTGSVLKTGTGVTELLPQSGSNTYTGGTMISEGALAISSDAALGAVSGDLNLNSGTLQFNADANLDPNRKVILSPAGGTINTQDYTSTLAQAILGVGGLTKDGSGTLILTGNNPYQGGTTIAAGTLQLGDGGASGSILGNVANNGILAFNRSDEVTFPGVISGSGGVLQQGSGKTILTADNTYTGTTTITNGILQVGNGGTTGSIVGDIVDEGTLAISRSDYLVIGGRVSGSGNVVQKGPGRLDLTGNSGDFTGDLYVAGGILGVVNNASLGARNIYVGTDVEAPTATSGTLILGTGASLTGSGLLNIARDAGSNGTVIVGAAAGEAPAAPGILSVPQVRFGAGTGNLVFNHTDNNYAFDSAIPGGIAGTGAINVYSGRTILAQNSMDFSGPTTVHGGILQVNNRLGGTMNVLPGGRLEGVGTVGPTTNAGVVAPGKSSASDLIGVLSVQGDYTMNGGMLDIDAVLGSDASPADLLVVRGNTSGSSLIKVTNRGGLGATTHEGIEIVEVLGNSNGKFSLIGDYVSPYGQQAVIAGAYAYSLYQGSYSNPGDGNWYLRNNVMIPVKPIDPTRPPVTPTEPPVTPTEPPVTPTNPPVTPIIPPGGGEVIVTPDGPQVVIPTYQPGAPLYEAYPQILASLNRLPTLQQRVGNRIWLSDTPQNGKGNVSSGHPSDGNGIWARVEGSREGYKPEASTTGVKYDIDILRLQMGVDRVLYTAKDGSTLVGGLTAHYGQAEADIKSLWGLGRIKTDGYGFGGTLTWYDQSGLYIDGQAQATWFNSNITSHTLGAKEASGNDGFGYAFGLEVGKAFAINQHWSVTPQAQLVYSSVDFDSFTDRFGARVSSGNNDSLLGRLGVALNYENSWRSASGDIRRLKAYGIANLYYEFLDGTEVNVSGINLKNRNDRLWGGIGVGGSYNWDNDNKSLYGEVGLNSSLKNFGDNYAVVGKVGFRVRY